jgi:hypothetical protein
MIQFDIHRFGKLAKWSLRNDRSYFVRTFLQVFVVQLLMFLFFTTGMVHINGGTGNYSPCAGCTMMFVLVIFVIGPSTMFYSLCGKHDKQALLLLPASNFEKYLVRYSGWILLIPIGIVASLGADLIQYVVNMLMGHDYTIFVVSRLIDMFTPVHTNNPIPMKYVALIVTMSIWLNSCFALGGTFFRSRKYAWVLTALTLIAIGVLQIWLFPSSSDLDYKDSGETYAVFCAFYLVWSLVNFWLSYRCFCRTQNIGKFVNF